jgi:hypothetical protein
MPYDALIEPTLITTPPPRPTMEGATMPVSQYPAFTLTVQTPSNVASAVSEVGPLGMSPAL